MPSDTKVTVAEITKHSSPEDCWIVVNGNVYDLSKFAPNHPGGPAVIYKYAGKDGSATYNAFHSRSLIEDELSSSEKKGPLDEASITDTWRSAQAKETAQHATNPDEKPPLASLISLQDFERAFEKAGSKKAWVYISSASNDLLTLAANLQAWQRLWFRPRIMRNVSKITTHTRMLGADVAVPVYIAPMGIAKTAGPEGEAALGSGAHGAGIIHCMSTAASLGVEEVLASVPADYPYFFQLYVDRTRSKTETLLRRLEAFPNVRAVFLTVDVAVMSKREADERLIVQETASDAKGGGLARNTGSFIDPAVAWEDLPWVRRHTTKPIVVKGIQSASDARLAMRLGCAGIVVSNHGGRALDGAPATLLVLLELRRDCPEVFEKMEVFIDGGVRRGSDVLKAICLGASGVGVGRPFQCAVLYGRAGVEHAAGILQDEVETAMRLCGITDLDKVRGDLSYLNTKELEQFLPPPLPAARSSWGGWFGRRVPAKL